MENPAKGNWKDPERVKHLAETYSLRYGEIFWNSVSKLVNQTDRSVIADFGCGSGVWLHDAGKRFNATFLYAFDASEEMLEYAKEILDASIESREFETHCVDFDTDSVPLKHNTLDLAFTGYMFHEIANPQNFAKQVFDCMKRNGVFIVFDFVSGNPEEFITSMVRTGMDEERARKRYPHMCKHADDDIVKILESAGFISISWEAIDGFRVIAVGVKG
ncbi:MAG: class I SAM-dependent methyltransferase [Candidatus Thorarchaeota archaeon]|nr:class I SAM-dependent methyltransferase [Candidatus Thorarchaeota archaeon]